MMLITDAQVDRAIHVVDTSDAAALLTEAMAYKPQGRKRRLSLRTWLVGAFLAIEVGSSFKNTTIHQVLTQGLSIEKQHELGVRFVNDNDQIEVLTMDAINYISRHLPTRLAYTPSSANRWKLNITPKQMEDRRLAMETIADELLTASLVLQDSTSTYALDGSGTWSWGRSKSTINDDDDVRAAEDVVDRVRDEVLDGEVTGGAALPQRKTSRKVTTNHDPDAAIGSKTAKMGGRESFFGYVIDAAIRVARPGEPRQPVVMEAMRLSPASTDVVGPTLSLLDRLTQTPTGVTDIVVDRHYSYKRVDRWADELIRRGISQHFDLRGDEQGFKSVNGMRLAAGWMHCPATPDQHAKIPRPGLNATKKEREAFVRKIEERRQFAMDRHQSILAGKGGATRWMCPAMAGNVGCPLRPGTVATARETGLPVVQDPPEFDTAPSCCTNKSGVVTDRSDAMRKHQQPNYWGTEQWAGWYDIRTYVESYFGSLKDPDSEGVRRGFTKFVGLPMMTIAIALAGAVCNVRHQRKFWMDDPNRPDHPLLSEDEAFHGHRLLTAEEVQQMDHDHLDERRDSAA